MIAHCAHCDEDPTDDRIENLRIVSRAEHILLHRRDLLAGRGLRDAA